MIRCCSLGKETYAAVFILPASGFPVPPQDARYAQPEPLAVLLAVHLGCVCVEILGVLRMFPSRITHFTILKIRGVSTFVRK